jgi:hypothetical protein
VAAVADLDTGAGGIVEEPVGVDGLVSDILIPPRFSVEKWKAV